MIKLTNILGTEPDGRELFRYRVNDAGYEQARTELRGALSRRRPSQLPPEEAALFCIFGAEWWRREHKAGPWSWNGIREALGITGVHYNDVVSCVQHGLSALKRPVMRGGDRNAFLITLACEGGLPLHRLDVDGANLQTFFRAVLEHFAATGITGEEPPAHWERVARLHGGRLPLSLRQDVVFRLSGELVGQAWRLRLALGEDVTDPIPTLDRTDPNWRDKLPLAVSDRSAESLIRGLMRDVAQVAQGNASRPRFITRLVLPASKRPDDRPVLQRHFSAPLSLDDEAFKGLFGTVPDAQRVQLRVRNDRGDTLRVGVLGHTSSDHWSWQPDPHAVLVGSGAAGQLVLEALARHGQTFEAIDVDGAGRLTPLPWVFRRTDERTWELVGTGSTTRREPELLIAIPLDTEAEGGQQEPVGEMAGRKLLRIAGEVRVVTHAGTVRIRTGQVENSASAFELRGPLFRDVAVGSGEVWKGLPLVKGRFGVVELTAPAEVRKAGGEWQEAHPEHVGTLEIRAIRDGEIVFQDRVTVAPRDLAVRLDQIGTGTTPGVVEVKSGRLSDAGVSTDPLWTQRREVRLPTVRIEVLATGKPPARLPIRLSFGHTFIDGTVAFPCRAMRFEFANGNEVSRGTALHARRLGGVRAVGLAPPSQGAFHVTLRAEAPGATLLPPERTFPLHAEVTGEHVLELRDLQSAILAMLDATDDLDAQIRVSLWQRGSNARPIDLFVRRYDWRLVPDHETGDVALAEFDPSEVDAEAVTVEARPFTDIGRVETLRRLVSPRYHEPRWVFGPEERERGPWLITARQEGWYRCRPVAFLATGAERNQAPGLEAILQIGNESARQAALRRHLQAMGADWTNPDWKLVDAYARLLGDLPASTFDIFRVIISVPSACTALALRAAAWDATRMVAVIDGLDELIFTWETLPLSAWASAFEGLHQVMHELMPDFAIPEVAARASALSPWVYPAGVAFFAWHRRKDQAANVEIPRELELAFNPAALPHMKAMRNTEMGEMIRRHAIDDTWPNPVDALLALPAQWAVSPPGEMSHRKRVLEAPVMAALAASGKLRLERETLMLIESAKAFDETYFDLCFKLTYSSILASGQGVW